MHINLNELRPKYAKGLTIQNFSIRCNKADNVYVSDSVTITKGAILYMPYFPYSPIEIFPPPNNSRIITHNLLIKSCMPSLF